MFLVILILLGVGLYFLFSNKGKANVQFPSSKSSEETLKLRYVNGEIDEATYLKMKETLNN